MPSLKSNIFFNYINTFVNLIFPIVVFPFVARVLTPQGIGQYNYIYAIITYCVMVASLGIPLYAVKKTAQHKDDKKSLDKNSSEIFLINIITVVAVSVFYIITVSFLIESPAEKILYLVFGCNIYFSFMNVEWYFQGKENFKFIAIRNVIIKSLSVLLIFLLIRSSNDVIIYIIITVLSTVGYSITNFIRFLRNVKFKVEKTFFKNHLSPILFVFILNISTSIYSNLDTVMIGLINDNFAVGQYTSAIKIVKLVIGIIISVNTVLLPRLSYYFKNQEDKKAEEVIKKTAEILYLLCIPSIVGLIILAEPITSLFSGSMYLPSVLSMQILTPIIFCIAATNLIGIQIFYVRNKIWMTIVSTIVGAVINFTLNMILIPLYSFNGAAIATTIAEASVLVVQVILGHKLIKAVFPSWQTIKVLVSAAMMGLTLQLSWSLPLHSYLLLFVNIFIGIFVYIFGLLISKHELLDRVLNPFSNQRVGLNSQSMRIKKNK